MTLFHTEMIWLRNVTNEPASSVYKINIMKAIFLKKQVTT